MANHDIVQEAQKVFYNPIQQFNRDLSVLAIRTFGEDICERRRSNLEKGREKRSLKRQRKGDVKAGQPVKIQKLGEEDTEQQEAPMTGAQAEEGDVSISIDAEQPETNNVDVENGQQKETAALNLMDLAKTSTTPAEEAESRARESSVPPIRILDALSATGLRALRYAKELPFATSITANDMDSKAVKSMKIHIKYNDVSSKVTPVTGNALTHMYSVAHPPPYAHGPHHVPAKYDVIDLDPYGTAVPFLDAALQALNDGGMLCVTCTDSGVFASCGYSEKTFALYGGLPVKGLHSHEAGLRLIAHAVAMTGAKYGIAIEPLLSLSIDFYARLFIRVRRSPAEVKFLGGKTMLVYECDAGCGAWTTQMIGRNHQSQGKNGTTNWKHSMSQGPTADKLCEHCGSKTHVAGPMWAGPLHNAAFIEKVLDHGRSANKDIYATTPRIEGMLETALEELIITEYKSEEKSGLLFPQVAPSSIDPTPFFFMPSALAKVIHCQSPNEAAFKGALRHAGYRATRSHCRPGSIKTNAPWSFIWNVMREWIAQKAPIVESNIRPTTAGYKILKLDRKTTLPIESEPTKDLTKDVETDESTQTVRGTAATAGDDAAHDVKQVNGVHKDQSTAPTKVVFAEALGRDKPGKKLIR